MMVLVHRALNVVIERKKEHIAGIERKAVACGFGSDWIEEARNAHPKPGGRYRNMPP